MRGPGTRCLAAGILAAALMACTTGGSVPPPEVPSAPVVRVGTFDSRAVALAYYRSEPFRLRMREMGAAHEQAKAAGDEARVAELEAEGPAQQALMHKQVFGTWPVDEILESIEGQIPEIAHEAGVDVIVSRWNIVHLGAGVEFVDVTDLMVRPFHPDEKTRKIIGEIQDKDPVPLDQLEHLDD